MTGVEFAVGYLAAWAWRKARRVAGRVDAEVDQAVDAALERLRGTVAGRLRGNPALQQLESEAAAGADRDVVPLTERMSGRVQSVLKDAAEKDRRFATRLAALVREVREAEQRSGRPVLRASAISERSVVTGGDISGIVSTGENAVNIQDR